jgi:hypothetical protein
LGVVAGMPQALRSAGSGAVAQAPAGADEEAPGEAALDPVEPLVLHATARTATAQAVTRSRGDGMGKA